MVRHKEGSQYRLSLQLASVMEVQSLIARARTLEGPGLDNFRRTHAILSERYGERLVVSSAPHVYYERRWDPVMEEWIVVCVTSSTMEVYFGRRGTVVVETKDEMPLD
jgi:hypothetical protein